MQILGAFKDPCECEQGLNVQGARNNFTSTALVLGS